MSTVFIIARTTARQFRLEAASSVKPTDNGYSFVPAKRDENDQAVRVMDALMSEARNDIQCYRTPKLETIYQNAVKNDYLKRFENTKYVSAQGNRPAMIIVR